MPRTVQEKKGKEYLPDAPLLVLVEMHKHEHPGKSKGRLRVAVLRKRNRKIESVAEIVERNPSTASRLLRQMEH